ncbi:MAG TPA: hypothetical protein VFT06_04670, partial [Flavisolibacter sp.]|nr:hypothetical protein [Flavisolibacter sp.]
RPGADGLHRNVLQYKLCWQLESEIRKRQFFLVSGQKSPAFSQQRNDLVNVTVIEKQKAILC